MKYPWKEPKLSKPANNDLSKQWCVEYGAYSQVRDKIIRKRVTLSGDTIEERLKQADEVIKYLNDYFKNGDVFVEPLGEPEKEKQPKASDGITGKSTIKKALEYYQATKLPTLSKQSGRTYTSIAKLFTEYLKKNKLQNLPLNRFDTHQANLYFDRLLQAGGSNNKHNKHLGFISTFFNFYLKRRTITENPCEAISELAENAGNHKPFKPDQIADIKTYLEETNDRQLWLFINFIYYTFSRPHEEVRLLKVSDIERNTIRIDASTAKGNRVLYKKIPPGLEQLLQQYRIRLAPSHYYVFSRSGIPGPEPVGEAYFYDRHKKMLDSLELPKGYDLYGWKHTGVISLYIATRDMKKIQRQCGHTSIEQTDQYLRDLGLFAEFEDFNNFPEL
ncbi:tyrosine-type recombinase/integrase [Arsenicibacter rosenii]|uniref:tyrosine-type recombinase/integrase n=1 Tax=Arsenicibacter rosenii TaxID=1750698 RepID=UPI0015A54D6F|nr:site-specific integrase [Arsenicibacter rosenii]